MITFVDLVSQYKLIADKVEEEIFQILRTANYVNGFYNTRLEKELSNYLDSYHVLGVSNGTDAIQVLLEAAGIKGGVIVPTNSFIATAFGITRAKCKPIFVDINPDTYLLDLDEVEFKLKTNKKYIKAIFAVDLYGQQPDMCRLVELSNKYKVHLFQDSAQSLGSLHNSRPVGYYSKAATTSFYPSKNLGGCCQGGAIITNNEEIYNNAKIIINQGSKNKYDHIKLGGNYRIDPINSVYIYHALGYLSDWNEKRKKIAEIYNNNFSTGSRPVIQPNSRHVWHLYEYKTKNEECKKRLCDLLNLNEIEYGFHYPKLITETPMYYENTKFQNALSVRDHIISLPMHPFMSEDDAIKVVNIVKQSESSQ